MSKWDRLCYTPNFFWNASTESLFPAKKVSFTKDQYPDQTGKVWLVTGSTSGIGFEVAVELAHLGAEVWIHGRSQSKAEEHLKLLQKRVPSAKANYVLMDFADLTTIKPGIQKFLSTGSPLHGIVHNAGVMLTPKSAKTAQGWEMQLGTNCIATWLLQSLLDDVLLHSTKSIEGRIVWVSSLAHLSAPYKGEELVKDPTNLGFHNEAYGISKAVNAMQCFQWSKIHPDANVKSMTVHPGIISSNLSRELGSVGQKVYNLTAHSCEYGGICELAAALGDFPNNSYIVPWGKLGKLRPDIAEAGQKDLTLAKWLDDKIKEFK